MTELPALAPAAIDGDSISSGGVAVTATRKQRNAAREKAKHRAKSTEERSQLAKDRSAYNKAWKTANKDKVSAYNKANYKYRYRKPTPEKWASETLVKLKCRAKKEGFPFDLVAADLVVPDVCPVTLEKLVVGPGRSRNNCPSVDKFIPALGYVRGNVRVISMLANRLKSDCTEARIFYRLGAYMDGDL